jgi:hypothetical protein
MLKKINLIIVCLAFIIGCTGNKSKVSKTEFSLRKDLSRFSEKLNNGDSLRFNAMLGVCESECMEHNLIFKQNDSVFIQSYIENIYPHDESKTLEKVLYKYVKTDTLNFEDLFLSIKDLESNHKDKTQYTFQAIFKQDTIGFHGNSLVSILRILDYYNEIKRRLYPDEVLYKPV